jgi:hypothetical protein
MTAAERLKIEAANLTSSKGALFIRNLGGANVTIATIYIIKPGTINPLCTIDSVEIYRGTSTDAGTVPTLYPGRVHLVRFTVDANCGVSAGFDYVVKMITEKGTEFAVTVTAS